MAVEQTEAVLHLAKATRRYGNRAALDQVDLELEEGEVYALIGRNGAGKSTLAKAAIGALALDEGSVRVLGADPSRDRYVRREIGVRRPNLAAAIVHRPRLLVLDEPTEGLDTETWLILRRLIARLRADRTAILLISHNA